MIHRLSFLALMIAALLAPGASASEPAPNFVLIFVDDLGYGDIGPFGATKQQTPHLDRLAREGRKLTSFYAAPVCSPSRASLLTGCYPKRVGIPAVLFPGQPTGLNASETTLPELLRQQGYRTMCVGKWHLGDQPAFLPTHHGFDQYFGLPYSNDMGPVADGARKDIGKPGKGRDHPPLPLLRQEKVVQVVKAEDQEKLTEQYTDEAIKFLTTNKDRPFFLYLAHTAIHVPLYPSAKFQGHSKNGPLGDWVEEVDASVGRVMDALRELKLDSRTLVLFTSDNGGVPRRGSSNAPLRGAKGSTFEGGMREPTIVRWTGKIPANTSSDALCCTMDVLPTFVRLAGGKVPADRVLDGKDIWPVMSGDREAPTPHEAFFYFAGQNLRAVRSGPWKLELTTGKLYNLDTDIGEAKDVAPENPDVVKKLTAHANRMKADLGDGKFGPGCRPAGKVDDPRPLIGHDGKVRPEVAGQTD